jgi:hypothetical protein
MMRVVFSFVVLMLSGNSFAQNGGTLTGRIVENINGKGLPYASITVEYNDTIVRIDNADSTGVYVIRRLPPRKYDVEISAIGYGTTLSEEVKIEAGRITTLNKILSYDVHFIGPHCIFKLPPGFDLPDRHNLYSIWPHADPNQLLFHGDSSSMFVK